MKCLSAFLAILTVALSASAAMVAGDWRGTGSISTFAVTLEYPGKSIPRTYNGTLNGDEIKFTVDSSGQTSEFLVKRVK